MEDPQVLYPQQLIIGNKLRITLDKDNVVHVQQPVPGKSDVVLSAGDWQDIGTMDVLNALFGAIGPLTVSSTLAVNEAETTLAGTTAGDAYWVQDEVGTVKRVVVALSGYENTTAVAQTITFPVPFTTEASIAYQPASFGATVNTTTLTLPVSMASAVSGNIEVIGI